MAAQTSKSRKPLTPCAIKGCKAAPRRRKYCAEHSTSAPMRTLVREGRFAELAKPVVAAPAKKSRTRKPKAARVTSAQVKTAKAQARVETVAGQRFVLVDGVAYRIAA